MKKKARGLEPIGRGSLEPIRRASAIAADSSGQPRTQADSGGQHEAERRSVHLSLRTSAAALVWQSPGQWLPVPASAPPSTCHCEPVPQHWCGNPPVSGFLSRLRGYGHAAAFGGAPASDVAARHRGIATSASPPRNDSLFFSALAQRCSRVGADVAHGLASLSRFGPSVHLSLRTSPQTGVAIPRSAASCPDFGGTVTLPRLGVLPRRTWVQNTGGLPRRLRLLAMTACFSALAQRWSGVGADVAHGLASLSRFGPFLHLSLRTSAAALVWQSPGQRLPVPASAPPSACHCEPVPQHWCGNPTVSGFLSRLRGYGHTAAFGGAPASDVAAKHRGIATSASPPRNDSLFFSALAQRWSRVGADVAHGLASLSRFGPFLRLSLRTSAAALVWQSPGQWLPVPTSGVRSRCRVWGCSRVGRGGKTPGDCHVGFASSQ